MYCNNLAPTSAASSLRRGSVTFFNGASQFLLQTSLITMPSRELHRIYRAHPWAFSDASQNTWIRHSHRLTSPSNEECGCSKAVTMKLTTYARELQCHRAESPPLHDPTPCLLKQYLPTNETGESKPRGL